jgi:endonuclease/exonuclease/phosphatase family metal-dependent hydrolase
MSVPLRVLAWNVRGLRDDRAALVATIRAARPHVVLVQEAPRVWRWRTRGASFAADCGLVVAAGAAGTDPASGNLVLTDLAVGVRNVEVVRLERTPGQYPRAAVVLRGTMGGAQFTAAGVHLGLTGAERARHVDALHRTLDGEPALIVGGDLNETPGGPVWRTLGTTLADTAGTDGTPTYSTTRPVRRIDAIFADPALPVLSYEVLDTDAVRRATDHRPVLVTLDI